MCFPISPRVNNASNLTESLDFGFFKNKKENLLLVGNIMKRDMILCMLRY